MIEEVKIYIRSPNKIFVMIEEELLEFENQSLENIIENLKDNYDLEENIPVEIILHFLYFLVEEEDKKYFYNIKKKFKYREEKIYLDRINNKYINLYLERNEIFKLKDKMKKAKLKLESVKVDFYSLYNLYKTENVELLQIGELESFRLKIEEGQIVEFEKIDLSSKDIGDRTDFDFGEMKVIGELEEEIREIFLSSKLYDKPNFLKKEEFKFSRDLIINDIKKRDIGILILFLLFHYSVWKIIPLEKEKEKNIFIQREIKDKESKYIEKKKEELPDYSKEIMMIEEINEEMERKEYYSFIKFLIDNSFYGIDYIKIIYENKQWIVQGEINKFESFNKFEKNILKKYPNSKLGYIKDRDEKTLFEYNIIEN